jgi:hypothetical protein
MATAETPVKIPSVVCRYCTKPMQAADSIVHEGKIVSVRYICGCRGTVYSHNVHAGQK